MIWLDVAHHTTLGLSNISSWSDVYTLVSHLPSPGDMDWGILAQLDTDPFRGVRQTIADFFTSGRVWIFLAGFVLGYIIRGMTTYG
jgi:hypothetical protein